MLLGSGGGGPSAWNAAAQEPLPLPVVSARYGGVEANTNCRTWQRTLSKTRLLHRPTTWTVPPGAWSRGRCGMATRAAGRVRAAASGYSTSPRLPRLRFAALIAAIRGAPFLPSDAIAVTASRSPPNVHRGKVAEPSNEIRYLSLHRYQVPAVSSSVSTASCLVPT